MCLSAEQGDARSDIKRIERRQTLDVLGVRHAEVFLEVVQLCVADVGAVEEGAEDEEDEDGEDASVELDEKSTGYRLLVGETLDVGDNAIFCGCLVGLVYVDVDVVCFGVLVGSGFRGCC